MKNLVMAIFSLRNLLNGEMVGIRLRQIQKKQIEG